MAIWVPKFQRGIHNSDFNNQNLPNNPFSKLINKFDYLTLFTWDKKPKLQIYKSCFQEFNVL